MNGLLNWIMVLTALIGHGGLHIAIYNRVNGFGWPRKVVKSIVKFFLLTTITIPLLVVWFDGDALRGLLFDQTTTWQEVTDTTKCYALICYAAWIVFGIPWLIWRPIFGVEWVDAPRKITVLDVAKTVPHSLTLTAKATFESRLPLNQLLELSIEEIELPVVGLPDVLDGYRIAHVSDVHLTGEIHADYAKTVMQRAIGRTPGSDRADR